MLDATPASGGSPRSRGPGAGRAGNGFARRGPVDRLRRGLDPNVRLTDNDIHGHRGHES